MFFFSSNFWFFILFFNSISKFIFFKQERERERNHKSLSHFYFCYLSNSTAAYSYSLYIYIFSHSFFVAVAYHHIFFAVYPINIIIHTHNREKFIIIKKKGEKIIREFVSEFDLISSFLFFFLVYLVNKCILNVVSNRLVDTWGFEILGLGTRYQV